MARNGAGVYSRPAGTTPADGDDLLAAPFNLLMNDIATDLNTPRPIGAGGTGAANPAAALTALGLTTDGAALVASADYAAMRALMALVPQSSAVDATTGRLMTVGAFGIGTDVAPVLADVDATGTRAGLYRIITGVTGTAPPGSVNQTVLVSAHTIPGNFSQIAVDLITPFGMAYRVRATGVWSAWRQVNTNLVKATSPQALAGTDDTAFMTALRTRDAIQPRSAAVVLGSVASVDITGIPTWANRVSVTLSGVSGAAVNLVGIQLGDSGGIETTGYQGVGGRGGAGGTITSVGSTTLIPCGESSLSNVVRHGTVDFVRMSGNTWIASGVISDSVNNRFGPAGGRKTLSGTLDRVRVLINVGVFDGGEVLVSWGA